MNAQRVIEELGKGPPPAQVWGNTCDDAGADCVRCPARIENEDRESTKGSFIVGALAIFGIGVVVGAGAMVAFWFVAVPK